MFKNLFVAGAVKVLIRSREEGEEFVPLAYSTLYSLPDCPVRSEKLKKIVRIRRLCISKLGVKDGKIKGKPVHRIDACNFDKVESHVEEILNKMQNAEPSFFPEDLPIYFDALTAAPDSLDWTTIEKDVIVALNSGNVNFDIPDTEAGKKLKKQLNNKLPILDISEHGSSILDGELLTDLAKQLIDMRMVSYREMKLIPARWVQKVNDHALYVRSGKPIIVQPRIERGPRVKVGAFDVGLGGVA